MATSSTKLRLLCAPRFNMRAENAKTPVTAAVENIQTTLSTLLANGVLVDQVESVEGGRLLHCKVVDRFGFEIPYVVLHAPSGASDPVVGLAAQSSTSRGAKLILIGDFQSAPAHAVVLSASRFHARFGGPVASLLPLHPDFQDRTRTLSLNRLPDDVTGVPSDVFEEYVSAGLQFVMARHVVHYGRSRSGERVPDGIATARGEFVLFDAKAASNGFEFDATTIRQFAAYVADYKERYGNLGSVRSFICVSSSFLAAEAGLQERSQDLLAECGVPLVTITAEELCKAVSFFKTEMRLREATKWSRLLTIPALTAREIQNVARAARRDNLATHEED